MISPSQGGRAPDLRVRACISVHLPRRQDDPTVPGARHGGRACRLGGGGARGVATGAPPLIAARIVALNASPLPLPPLPPSPPITPRAFPSVSLDAYHRRISPQSRRTRARSLLYDDPRTVSLHGSLHHALDLMNLRVSLPLALPLLILQLTSLMAASDRRSDCRADCRF